MLPESKPVLAPVADYRLRFLDGDGRCGARTAADILAETLARQGLACTVARQHPGLTVQGQGRRQGLRLAGDAPAADMLVVLDEALLERGDALAGLNPDGTLVVATPRRPQALRRALGWFGGTMATVDADGIADQTGAEPAVALLGAAARVAGFIDPDILGAATWMAYDRLWPYAARAAVQALDAGYSQVHY